jgi:putative permease
LQAILDWFQAKLANTQLLMLLLSLLVIFLLLHFLGHILAPLLVAIALAYVLDGIVALLLRCRVPRLPAIILVGMGVVVGVLFALLAVIPLLVGQLARLVAQVPNYFVSIREGLEALQAHYAGWINPEYVQQLLAGLANTLQEWGKDLLSFSLASIPGLITLLIYAVLVPVLVFFLLKDKQELMDWGKQFLPRDRTLLIRVWAEVDVKIGNYIRGKFWETFIVGIVTWMAFWILEHEYALLLGVLTGLSVWIPFIGAAVVTVPVVMMSFFQWGWSDATLYALIAYTIIQVLDANVLIPWLFSEVVNLHPIAIVVAILIFGNLWGIVGVFFAIPLAALVSSVLNVAMMPQSPTVQPGQ